MNIRSKKSKQAISEATPSVTSLPESGSGPTHSNKRDGPTTNLFGQDRAPASRSVRQAKAQGRKTKDTSGQHGSGSLASADLQQCLESKLKQLFKRTGSILFLQTWKKKITPAGRQYMAHIASAHHTNDSEYIFAPMSSPCCGDNFNNKHKNGDADGRLGNVARMVWPTTQSRDWKGPQGRAYKNKRSTSSTKGKVVGQKKKQSADLPTVAMWVESIDKNLPKGSVSGKTANGFRSVIAKGVQLNPALSRWLMGLPPAWDDCAVTVTRSVRRKRKRS